MVAERAGVLGRAVGRQDVFGATFEAATAPEWSFEVVTAPFLIWFVPISPVAARLVPPSATNNATQTTTSEAEGRCGLRI